MCIAIHTKVIRYTFAVNEKLVVKSLLSNMTSSVRVFLRFLQGLNSTNCQKGRSMHNKINTGRCADYQKLDKNNSLKQHDIKHRPFLTVFSVFEIHKTSGENFDALQFIVKSKHVHLQLTDSLMCTSLLNNIASSMRLYLRFAQVL